MRLPLVTAIACGFACGGSPTSGPDASNDSSTLPADASQIDVPLADAKPRDVMQTDARQTDTLIVRTDTRQPSTGTLPSGNTGIAARFPGDRDIASDPAVVFADDFESYANANALDTNWDSRYHNVSITSTAANVFGGSRAAEFRAPMTTEEISNGIDRRLRTEVDTLFLRYYSKFEGTFDVVGSSHNGATISAHYYMDGRATPGIPANGTNKFLIAWECWRGETRDANPGVLNLYVYHPTQRSMWGDHWFPDGTIMPNTSLPGDFGSDFVVRPNITPELGRWYSYELMVRANTPGMRDGRVAVWLDGVLVGDFPNLRLRDVATLKIDQFGIGLHVYSNPSRETRKWYDNVVAATSYIGPVTN